MKRILSILLAVTFIFAQDDAQIDEILPTIDVENTTEQIAEVIDSADTADTPAADADTAIDSTIHRILFLGVQTGDIPEFRTTLENMIRTRWGTERNVNFINSDVSARITRNLFSNRKIVVDSTLFDLLEKHNLQNTIVLLINIDDYSVRAVRRFAIGAGVEGKLKADLLFYEAANRNELFAAKLSSTSLVKKPPIFWRSLQERVTISADDLRKINSDLLNDMVEQGFEVMKIAVSSRK